MDIAYHGEDFAREHKDVLDNIRVDHPLKVWMDTAWVYAQAADQYQYGDVEDARQTQKSAEQAYNNAMRLLAENARLVSEHRLLEITTQLEQNRILFSID